MILPRTIWSVTEPALTPGSWMARFKEWVPCASLANLGNDIMCARNGCTDSRLSQVIDTCALPEKASQIDETKEKTKTAFNMKKEKNN